MVLKKGTLIGTYRRPETRLLRKRRLQRRAARRTSATATVQGLREGRHIAHQRAGCEEPRLKTGVGFQSAKEAMDSVVGVQEVA